MRRVLIALFVSLCLGLASPQTAQAHESPYTSGFLMSSKGATCVGGQAHLNHGDWSTYPGQWLFTGAYGKSGLLCSTNAVLYMAPGEIGHKWNIFRNGSLCYDGPWHTNAGWASSIVFETQTSIWHACNYGYGVHVNVTVDSSHFVNRPYSNGTRELAYLEHYKPTAGHCFCP